jgi:predicted transcriptional regulator
MASTTIRVKVEDKQRLERLARRLGKRRLTEALRSALELAEHATERRTQSAAELFRALGPPLDVGPTNAAQVDRLLYRRAH